MSLKFDPEHTMVNRESIKPSCVFIVWHFGCTKCQIATLIHITGGRKRFSTSMRYSTSVALIIGGAKGYGKPLIRNLLGKGSKVIVADPDPKAAYEFQEESKTPFDERQLKFLKCDLYNKNGLDKTFEEARTCFGYFDIVCNNVSGTDNAGTHPVMQVDLITSNVATGTYKAIQFMSKQNGGEGGIILNFASAAGVDLTKRTVWVTETNHDIITFSRSFRHALPFNIHGIRINSLCYCKPSPIEYKKNNEKDYDADLRRLDILKTEGEVTASLLGDNYNSYFVGSELDGKIYIVRFEPVINVMYM